MFTNIHAAINFNTGFAKAITNGRLATSGGTAVLSRPIKPTMCLTAYDTRTVLPFQQHNQLDCSTWHLTKNTK
jgi:hypothetical protein